MSQIIEIIEGWANVIKDQFDAVDPVTKAISKKDYKNVMIVLLDKVTLVHLKYMGIM